MISETKTTAEPITWSRGRQQTYLECREIQIPGLGGLTPENMLLLDQETPRSFEPVGDIAPEQILDEGLWRAVGTGRAPCPFCGETKKVGYRPRLYRGTHTGILVAFPSTCICFQARMYCRHWMNPNNIAPEHRDCTMNALLSGGLRRSRLAAISDSMYGLLLACLQAFPNYSALIVGRTGAGKSTLMAAMYDRALRQWVEELHRRQDLNIGGATCPLWKTQALSLATQLQEWAFRDKSDTMAASKTPEPVCWEGKVRQAANAKFDLSLFLDEFDKWKASEFRCDNFHQLCDLVYSHGGQFVACSNSSASELVTKLGDMIYGEPMLRRLVDLPHGLLIDFHRNRIYVNRQQHSIKDDKLVVEAGAVLRLANLNDKDLEAPVQEPIDWTHIPARSKKSLAQLQPILAKGRPSSLRTDLFLPRPSKGDCRDRS